MNRYHKTVLLTLGSILAATFGLLAQQIGERPAVSHHLNEGDIENGRVPLSDVIEYGRTLFTAVFNRLDGHGRPSTPMNRTTGPEAHSCASCHNRPRTGGGGDFATNVFLKDASSERKTMALYGAGPIEMLAREMTYDLREIRLTAIQQAFLSFRDVTVPVVAKGVDFGSIIAHPDGTVDTSGVRGISPDLVVRPFHQNGAAVSIRSFTNEAMNQHLGMQAAEVYGIGVDADEDGVADELTIGDVTAIALFQAQLPTPGRVIPGDSDRRRAAEEGEKLFAKIECTNCHIPEMRLKKAMFTEANPFNPEWKVPFIVTKTIGFDMTKEGEKPRLEAAADGGAVVRAYTDLKRHNLCDSTDQFFCNEKVSQDGIPLGFFLTQKLWDAGSSAPYGHRGDLSTLTEAIEHHAGEARASRDQFVQLSAIERASIIEFLKTLQILPPGSPLVVHESALTARLQVGEPASHHQNHLVLPNSAGGASECSPARERWVSRK